MLTRSSKLNVPETRNSFTFHQMQFKSYTQGKIKCSRKTHQSQGFSNRYFSFYGLYNYEGSSFINYADSLSLTECWNNWQKRKKSQSIVFYCLNLLNFFFPTVAVDPSAPVIYRVAVDPSAAKLLFNLVQHRYCNTLLQNDQL